MRVNIYAEEMTDRVELVSKIVDGVEFTGVRFYLELPVTVQGANLKGPFLHHPGDDDSSAVTFWGKASLDVALHIAIDLLSARLVKQGGVRRSDLSPGPDCTLIDNR